MPGSKYGHGNYHSPARKAHQQTLKTPEDRSQKPIRKSAGPWWIGKSRDEFSAEAKRQAERLSRESAGTVIRLPEPK